MAAAISALARAMLQSKKKDAALERRFQPIKVEEPTPEQTVGILTGLCSTYEEHHEVHSPLTSEKPPSGREAQ